MARFYKELGRIGEKYDFTSFIDGIIEYADKKTYEVIVKKTRTIGLENAEAKKDNNLTEKSCPTR